MVGIYKVVLSSLAFGALIAAPLGTGFMSAVADDGGYMYEESSIHYGARRPFSFYYPYNYEYYYPHPQYYSNSNSCYWTYTNGTYVYVCD